MFLNFEAVALGGDSAVTDSVLRAVNVVCGVAAVLLGDAESQSRLNIEISIVRNSLLGKSKLGLL